MSLRSLESAILANARHLFVNGRLRLKDIMEWSSGEIKPQAGEVTERLPEIGAWVTIKKEHDKRPTPPPEGKQ